MGERGSGTLVSMSRMHSSNVPSLTDNFLVGHELSKILESHPQLTILNRGLQRIHSSERGPADTSSIWGESSAMARANKLMLFLVPGDRATEVRTDGCENLKLTLTIFRHIDRFFWIALRQPSTCSI